MFEYRHISVEAKRNVEERYPAQEIQDTLNGFGREGWELVAIVPDWEWDHETVSQDHEVQEEGRYPTTTYTVEAPYSVPVHISGWYCTFKRSV